MSAVPSVAGIARQVLRHDSRRERLRLTLALVATAVLSTLALGLLTALPQAGARFADVMPERAPGAAPAFTWFAVHSQHDARPVTVLLLEAGPGGRPPAPPGVPAFPAPGTAYVSPELARALTADPDLAGRVPGRVVGRIGPEGLAAPDAMAAVVATDLGTAGWAGTGWGSSDADHPTAVPVVPAALMVVLLTLVPWLVVCVALATGLASRMRPRAATLSMLGASRLHVRRFAATTTAVVVAGPSAAGAAVGLMATQLLAPVGVLGASWFPPAWPAAVVLGLVVVAVQVLVAAAAARAVVSRAHRDPWVQRRRASPAVRPLLLVAAVTGLVSMVVLGTVRWLTATELGPSSWVALWFVVTALGTALGGATLAGEVVRRLGGRVPANAPLPWVLAWRRHAQRRAPVVAQSAMVISLAAVFMVSSAVQTVMANQDGSARPGGSPRSR